MSGDRCDLHWVDRILRIRELILFFLVIAVLSEGTSAAQPTVQEQARYIVDLSRQVTGIARQLLDLDMILQYKLKRKFPIDHAVVASKSVSGNRQIELLTRRMAELHNTLPAGYDGQSEVQTNQKLFQELMDQHIRNIRVIVKSDPNLGGELGVAGIRKSSGEVTTPRVRVGTMLQAASFTRRLMGVQGAPTGKSLAIPQPAPAVPRNIPGAVRRDQSTSVITDFNMEMTNSKAEFSEGIREGF